MAGHLTVNIECRKRWWFGIALHVGFWLLELHLVSFKRSAEHYGGWISPTERVTSWLVRNALITEVN